MRIALDSFKTFRRKGKTIQVSFENIASLIYHDIFDYPLSSTELYRWKTKLKVKSEKLKVENFRGYYFLKGKKKLVSKRLVQEKISLGKRKIAKKAVKIIKIVPTAKMVGITGALSMNNASEDSDIDLMIITSKKTLWTTRALVWITLKIFGISLRKPGERIEKDKLCLNIWLDKSDLKWKKKNRNIFTAHEIAQVVPLVNKDNTYEKFINENKWIKDYWPNAVNVKEQETGYKEQGRKSLIPIPYTLIARLFEPFAYKLQFAYMKGKITRETITPTRALFHPVDWGRYVMSRLQKQIIAR